MLFSPAVILVLLRHTVVDSTRMDATPTVRLVSITVTGAVRLSAILLYFRRKGPVRVCRPPKVTTLAIQTHEVADTESSMDISDMGVEW